MYILSFNHKTRPRSEKNINRKSNVFDSARNLYDDRELFLSAFKSGLFPLKSTKKNRT